MNTDHNHSDHTHSDHDQPLQSVLRELDRDAVSVDHEALERIRELARRELTASAPVRYEAQQTAGPLSRALATLAAVHPSLGSMTLLQVLQQLWDRYALRREPTG